MEYQKYTYNIYRLIFFFVKCPCTHPAHSQEAMSQTEAPSPPQVPWFGGMEFCINKFHGFEVSPPNFNSGW